MKSLLGLSFVMPEGMLKEVGKSNVVEYSFELLDAVAADRLVWPMSNPQVVEEIKKNDLYARQDVVKSNRVLHLSYENPPIGAAMSFDTVPSIPYALGH